VGKCSYLEQLNSSSAKPVWHYTVIQKHYSAIRTDEYWPLYTLVPSKQQHCKERSLIILIHIWLLRNTVGYTYANIQNVGVSKIFVLMQSTFYLIKKQ